MDCQMIFKVLLAVALLCGAGHPIAAYAQQDCDDGCPDITGDGPRKQQHRDILFLNETQAMSLKVNTDWRSAFMVLRVSVQQTSNHLLVWNLGTRCVTLEEIHAPLTQ
jgi:hypothetical protein